MLFREAKLKHATQQQYQALDEAIRTGQFIRNKCLRLWVDSDKCGKSNMESLCKDLAKEFSFAGNLNSMARQAHAERAWLAVKRFYENCRNGVRPVGYPKFKKNSRSVEYKTSGWKLSDDGFYITFKDGFKAGTFSLYCSGKAREDILRSKINRVRVIRRADGYYAQFLLEADRVEEGTYTGEVIGIDLGLKYFVKDQNGNEIIYPQFLRKSERRLKKLQRRLSKKYRHGQKQSANYHKVRIQLGKQHLKVQRQRKDWALKQARALVASNDVVVYEDLRVANLVKNHNLAKSISDAAWSQFTDFLDYYGKLWGKAVVAVNPAFTSQDCQNCGHREKKSLSTRTHKCSNCGTELCRDQNAAINILKRGMEILGKEWSNRTQGHWGTASSEETTRETTTSTISENFDSESSEIASSVEELVISEPVKTEESPRL
ncbi:RNA-guided endonuclease InsQ/TnpB family protein [Euhalothece natronophila]|uniref:RNA-guided endonuclease InsQ/TnpB family protein n=1 Tax=Euhalothece natronophila TaxID=577489 RepID=UPI001C99A0C9|nr:RNA-guided endonuclease TnpB family protein [Euhalothece natronophila]